MVKVMYPHSAQHLCKYRHQHRSPELLETPCSRSPLESEDTNTPAAKPFIADHPTL